MTAILLRSFASVLALLLVSGPAVTVSAQQPSKKADEPNIEQIPAKLSMTLDPGGHWGQMHGVFFLPDGKHAVTVGAPSSVRLWEVETGRSVKVVYLPGVLLGRRAKAGMTSDGTRLAVPCAYFEGKPKTRRNAIYFLKMPECRLERVVQCEGEISAVALAPDGKRMAMADKSGFRTRLWNLQKDEPPKFVTNVEAQTLTFSPDGTRLVCSVNFRTSVIFDLKDGNKEVMTLTGGQAVWSPDGQSLATLVPNTPDKNSGFGMRTARFAIANSKVTPTRWRSAGIQKACS